MHRKVAQHYLTTRTATKEKILLKLVTLNSGTHNKKVLISSYKLLYYFLISGMYFVKCDYSII
jgi:hypothetical protein